MTEAQRLSIERLKKSGHFARCGRIGGLKTKRRTFADPDFYARIGRSGGEAVKEKYGREYFSKLGSRSPGSKGANGQA